MGQIVNRRRVFGSGGGIDYSKQYFTITALEDGFVDFSLCDSDGEHGISTDYVTSVSYSTDGGSTWTTRQNTGDVIIIEVYLYEGQQVLFKGIANSYYDGTACGQFQLNAQCSVSGNIMSLLYGDNFMGQTALPSGYSYTFYRLFRYCNRLADIDNLVLPATTLVEYCYSSMFSGCSSLVTAPKLSATLLAPYCYLGMFSDCTSLMNVPNDYLPATALANGCYHSMFFNCYSLTTAPQLPATRLASFCYQQMFYNCRSLSAISCMATNISASACTYQWVKGVSASGTFLKPSSMSSWTTGDNGIPSGWTIQNINLN